MKTLLAALCVASASFTAAANDIQIEFDPLQRNFAREFDGHLRLRKTITSFGQAPIAVDVHVRPWSQGASEDDVAIDLPVLKFDGPGSRTATLQFEGECAGERAYRLTLRVLPLRQPEAGAIQSRPGVDLPLFACTPPEASARLVVGTELRRPDSSPLPGLPAGSYVWIPVRNVGTKHVAIREVRAGSLAYAPARTIAYVLAGDMQWVLVPTDATALTLVGEDGVETALAL